MSTIHLEAVLAPASVAIVGPTSQNDSVGGVLARNLRDAGFAGPTALVPDVESLSDPPDLAILCGAPETVPGAVAQLGARGTRAVVVAGAPFSEIGERGRELQQAALDAACPHALRIVGTGSIGVLSPRVGLNASVAHLSPPAGQLAFVSQSGAIVNSVLDWAAPRGIGFSHLLSLGDMADVDFGDLLDYLATDPNTSAILLYIERIAHARKFLSAARIAARMKPVVVVKAGRYAESRRHDVGSRDARFSDEVHAAAFRRAGLLRAHTLEAMFTAVSTLALVRPPSGERLAILTNAGALGVLATDQLLELGGTLATLSEETRLRLDDVLPGPRRCTNPIDVGGHAGPERHASALRALARADEVDGVIAIHGPSAFASSEATAQAVADASRDLRTKRVFASWVGATSCAVAQTRFSEAGIPCFDTPGEAVGAFLALVEYKKRQELLMQTPPSQHDEFVPDAEAARPPIEGALADGRDWLSDDEVGTLLRAYGISCGRGEVTSAGLQLFIGVAEDPVFGLVLEFGHGGPAADRIDDRAVGLPPLNMPLARDLISQTRVSRALLGHGNGEAVVDHLALTLMRFCQLVIDHPEIAEIHANPIVPDAAGASCLGAQVRVRADHPASRDRLAIRPYPKELEELLAHEGSEPHLLRPLLPEDEPSLQKSFGTLTKEEIRLRFFSAPKRLSHQLAARLTQLDFDREMALALTEPGPPGSTAIHGVVRLHADANNEHGEFAVIVHHDFSGQGLGRTLMERIIAYARSRGMKTVFGDVLAENAAMRGLSRKLGFEETRSEGDAGVVRVTLHLGDTPA